MWVESRVFSMPDAMPCHAMPFRPGSEEGGADTDGRSAPGQRIAHYRGGGRWREDIMEEPKGDVGQRIRDLRRVAVVTGVLLLLQAAALIGLLSASGERVLLPITVDFPGDGGGRVQLFQLNVAVGAVALCVLVAVARLVVLLPAVFPRYTAGLQSGHRTARWTEFAFTASITVFLVGQLNGIEDIGALVPIYAITSGMVLFAVLQERTTVRSGHPMLPLAFGAAVGIVPWGVIAFHQVGAGVVGDGPSVIVRVLTLTMLGVAFAFAVTQWREQRAALTGGDPIGGERRHLVLAFVQASLFAWLVVAGVVLGGGG